jgi:hypothetical protein
MVINELDDHAAHNEAIDGTGSKSIARILSCTLSALWSNPEAPNAARTFIAWALTLSPMP